MSKVFQLEWSLVALLTSVLGCGAHEGDDGGPIGSASQGINGGVLVTTAQNSAVPYAAAVKIGDCSAVKIGTKRFLTAAHCVSTTATSKTITNVIDPTQITVPTYTLTKIYTHPTFRLAAQPLGIPGDPVQQGVYDITMFDVAETTPNIPTVSASRQFVASGTQDLPAVGYGYGDGCVASAANSGKKQTYPFDFSQAANLTTRVHYVAESSSATTCGGDSGGPLFRNQTGWGIVGVVSGLAFYTRVSNVSDWIEFPDPNRFEYDSPGYLLNTKTSSIVIGGTSFGTVNCAAMLPGPTDAGGEIQEVKLDHCDSYKGLVSGTFPGWRLRTFLDPALSGYFFILNQASALNNLKCLEPQANSIGGTNVVVNVCTESARQAWKFEDLPGEAAPGIGTVVPAIHDFKVINKLTGKCLGTTNGSGALGTDVRIFDCASTTNAIRWVYMR